MCQKVFKNGHVLARTGTSGEKKVIYGILGLSPIHRKRLTTQSKLNLDQKRNIQLEGKMQKGDQILSWESHFGVLPTETNFGTLKG